VLATPKGCRSPTAASTASRSPSACATSPTSNGARLDAARAAPRRATAGARVLETDRELLGKLYDAYSFGVLPLLGRLVAGDEDSYRYLAESIRMHPDQDAMRDMMEDAGFERCDYHNMTGGIVAIHRGFRAGM
jgi:ubiquinone/menaquinone biosynthesis C-methylase UbiE